MKEYRNQIITGDALEVLRTLPDGLVQCVVSSPPYFALRNYGVDGQIGMEESPEEFIDKLVAVFHEVRRVLRSDGTLWLNIGDTYANDAKWGGHSSGKHQKALHSVARRARYTGLVGKSLLGIPWRLAFALQADGWILRSDIIWHKPSCLPESVTDRPTKSHEYLFLLTKEPHYYYDAYAIREPAHNWGTRDHSNGKYTSGPVPISGGAHHGLTNSNNEETGRNKRSVWSVNPHPYLEAHFATFPPELITPCILAGSTPRACEQCGAPWQRDTEREFLPSSENPAILKGGKKGMDASNRWADYPRGTTRIVSNGWEPTCTCIGSVGTDRSIVLDPFMGAGTTALVALQHARHYLGIELNPEYVQLAQRRIACVQPDMWESEAQAV